MALYAMISAVAYLLGAIPFGFIIYRLRSGKDIRREGSGNIGATNVTRRAGMKFGIATLVLDFAKGYASVLLAAHLAPGDPVAVSLAAFAAVLGHVFPVYLAFRGGKGVATAAGVFTALAPAAILFAVAVFLLLFLLFRYVSLGSIVSAAAVPLFMLVRGGFPRASLASAIAVAILVVARHKANVERLLSGTETRLQLKRT